MANKIAESDQILSSSEQLPLLSLNHVSFICKSVSRSVKFYQEVLGVRLRSISKALGCSTMA
ncbi:hypothetical protein M8C21_026621 [Ambrosia artemisiifolia]|uniref:Glyoxalase/fosfomycin resistance/dioxygenase domain-containing protein n=1 Tax=Ambrosia artemisiifolia TaxID=4212 RepID=A0AAD5BYJ8_AMBAR|nr:hypothetical protein M8C21_026621 [Ambrosia artemisiifolia]